MKKSKLLRPEHLAINCSPLVKINWDLEFISPLRPPSRILILPRRLGHIPRPTPIRIHHVNLPVSVPVAGEDDLRPIRRPGGRPVGTLVAGELLQVAAVGVDHVNVRRGIETGAKDDLRPVGRPARSCCPLISLRSPGYSVRRIRPEFPGDSYCFASLFSVSDNSSITFSTDGMYRFSEGECTSLRVAPIEIISISG